MSKALAEAIRRRSPNLNTMQRGARIVDDGLLRILMDLDDIQEFELAYKVLVEASNGLDILVPLLFLCRELPGRRVPFYIF